MTIAVAIITFLLALGITLYPIISSRYNEKHQSQIHVSYQEQMEQVDTTAIDEARELAIQYNQAILEGVKEDAFDHDALLWASEDYKHQLNITGNGIMGYVEIPTIQVTLPIYHGTDDATLEKGVGHLLGSSLPVGGESTHTVLTAHSGMASQRMFSDLDLLKTGDVFYLDVLGERMAYQVDQIKTVLPYLHSRNIPYCKLYDEGFDRIGCIGCPLAGADQMRFEFARYPKYKQAYLRAFEKMLAVRKDNGKPYHQWKTAEDVMEWWLDEKRHPKVDADQLSLFSDIENPDAV